MTPLLAVEDAIARIAEAMPLMGSESVMIGDALGQTSSSSTFALLNHPPHDVSAMDGYAISGSRDSGASDNNNSGMSGSRDSGASDNNNSGSRDSGASDNNNIIGDSAAGHPFKGRVASGQAVRIFTGGFMPLGSDTVIIEENTKITASGQVVILESSPKGRYIRKMGQDFKKGDCLIKSGECLSGRQIALLAAAGHGQVQCRRKPKVAIISTGDELAAPGTKPREGGIIASNGIFLKHLVEYFGGEAIEFDLVGDNPDELAKVLAEAADADLIVSSGGASASDHDGVAKYINNNGGLAFWRIAMRPGKPLIFGHVKTKNGTKSTPLLGLPGNPVSTGVCGIVFVGAALNAMLGRNPMPETVFAKITTPLKANDERQDFLRANITHDDNGQRRAAAYDAQDSAMMKIFAQANGLIIRPPHAPALAIGACVPVLAIPPQI